MKIDFHVHSKITSSFQFEPQYMEEYTEECKILGIDAFAISEHCHANNFAEAYRYIDGKYDKEGDCYLVNGIKVFTGIEITTLEKFDVVVISNIDAIFALKKNVDKILNCENYSFIPIEKLADIINYEASIVILAHPYRRFDVFPNINYNVFNKFDAVEINATDLFKFDIEDMKKRIEELGVNLNKNITEGSDAHYPLQIGSVYSDILGDYTEIIKIKEQILQGNIKFGIAKEFRAKVKGARAVKKILCGKS